MLTIPKTYLFLVESSCRPRGIAKIRLGRRSFKIVNEDIVVYDNHDKQDTTHQVAEHCQLHVIDHDVNTLLNLYNREG